MMYAGCPLIAVNQKLVSGRGQDANSNLPCQSHTKSLTQPFIPAPFLRSFRVLRHCTTSAFLSLFAGQQEALGRKKLLFER
ncbi:hypothetical protein DVA81_19620, partial [Acinetobacter baumannii]